MITLFDRETGTTLGTITEEQLDFLIEHLVEEDNRDQDYFVDESTIAMLVEAGMDAELTGFLKDALGDRKSMEIVWEEH